MSFTDEDLKALRTNLEWDSVKTTSGGTLLSLIARLEAAEAVIESFVKLDDQVGEGGTVDAWLKSKS